MLYMKNKIIIYVVCCFLSISFYGQEKKSFDEIIKENKGKVIFVDFWASWCNPCRKEMKYSLELQEKYKDVVFIYLSIDLDENKWKKAVKKEHLEGYNYNFMTINFKKTSDFKISSQFDISVKSIPRYMIFNKEGVLINNDAPRPSEGEKLKKELEKYLIE